MEYWLALVIAASRGEHEAPGPMREGYALPPEGYKLTRLGHESPRGGGGPARVGYSRRVTPVDPPASVAGGVPEQLPGQLAFPGLEPEPPTGPGQQALPGLEEVPRPAGGADADPERTKVAAALRTADPDGTGLAAAIRDAFDLLLDGQPATADAGELIRLPRAIPHGLFNNSAADITCVFWVSPTRRLWDLFQAINNVADPAEVVRLAGLHEVNFLPSPSP